MELRHGDCLYLLKDVPDKSVDLVIIDPPYLKTKNNGYHSKKYTGGGAFGVDKRDYHNQLNNTNLLNGFDFNILNELTRIMKKVNIYIFCSKELLKPLLNYFGEIKNVNVDLLTWHKTNPVPTIKPINIIKNLIINSSLENDVVLDCFMGSGTTGAACKELNRNFIGIEIDNNYFEIAKKRIEEK